MPNVTNNSGIDKLEENQENYQNSSVPKQDEQFYNNKAQQVGQLNLQPQKFSFPGPSTGGSNAPERSPIEDLAGSISKGSGEQHPEGEGYVSKALLPEGYSKYPNYFFGIDNEDLYGKSQTTGSKLKNSLVKSVGKFGTTLLDGIVDPVYGTVKAISDGKFSSFYNNEYTRGIDAVNKSMEKNFPNFVSNSEKDASWYSPKHWATANFLGNIFENVGFMAGIGATAWLTGGVGEGFGSAISSVIPGLSRAAAMGKWAKAAETLDQIMSTPIPELSRVSTYSQELGKITKATEDVLNAKGAYTKFDVLNKAQRAIYSGVSNIGVASSMSLEATNRFRQSLIQDFVAKNGYQPGSDDLEKINDTTDKVGGTLFGLTAAMGMVTFHGLFKKALAKKEGEDILKKEIENLTLQEGDKKLGTMLRTPEQELKGEGTQYTQDIAEKKIPKNFLEKLQARTDGVANLGKKYGSKIYDPWGGVGMLEFSAIQPGVENYYKRKYEQKPTDIFSDGLAPGVKSIFTKEGFDALILGGLGAKLPEVISEKISGREKKEKIEKASNTSSAIEGLNKTYLSSYLRAITDSVIRGKSLNDSKLASVEAGDKKGELDAKSQELYNYLYPRVKFGLKNLVDHDLSIYKELSSTPEGMKQLVDDGIVSKFNDRDFEQAQKDFKEHLDHIQAVADRMDMNAKSLTIRFGNIRDKEGNRVYSDDVMEKMGQALHEADDASDRVKDIIEKHLSNLSIIHDVDFNESGANTTSRSVVNDLFQVFNAISNHAPVQEKTYTDNIKENINKRLADKNGFLETNKDIKQQYSKYVDDAISLYKQKMQYFNEYEDMKKSPSGYKDPNADNPIINDKPDVSPNSDKEEGEPLNTTVKANTASGEQEFEVGPKHYISNFITYDEMKNLGLANDSSLGELIKGRQDFSILGKNKTSLNIDLDGKKMSIPSKLLDKLHISREDEKNKTLKSKFYNDYKMEDLGNGLLEHDPVKDSLSFVYQDADGKIKRVSLDDIFTPAKTFEDLKRDIEELQKTASSDANDYPPVPPEGDNGDYEEFIGSGELKSLTNIYDTTEEPAYEDENETEFISQYNYWSKRKNTFENNINNTEWLKGSDIKNPNDLHMIAIHYGNQDVHGFSNFIPESYTIHNETIVNGGDNRNVERAAIAMVTVLKDTDGTLYTVDSNGKKLKKVDENHTKEDYDKMIFSYKTNAVKFRTGIQQKGQIKYHVRHLLESGIPSEEIPKIEQGLLESAIEDRKRIFDKKSYEIYTFTTSKGIPNEVYNSNNELVKQHNSVIDNKIISKQDLGEVGLLNVITQSSNESKFGTIYDSTGTANRFKLGSVVLKHGTNLILMKSRYFSPKETQHLYDVLRATAKEMVDSKSVKPSQKYINYLGSVVFFSNEYLDKATKKVHDSQVFFDNDGALRLGNSTPIPLVSLLDEFNPFSNDEVLNERPIKKQVLDYFAKQYHATSNKLLKENRPYEEISSFNDNGEPVFTKWDSYQHYLMDNQYPSGKKRDGKEIPLTTDIIVPTGPYEAPLKQKYNILSQQPVGEGEKAPLVRQGKKPIRSEEEKEIPKTKPVSQEEEIKSAWKLSDTDEAVHLSTDENNNPVATNYAGSGTPMLINDNFITKMEKNNPELAKELEDFKKSIDSIKEKHAKTPEEVKDEKVVEASKQDMTTSELKKEFEGVAKEVFDTKGRLIESKDHEITLESGDKLRYSEIEKAKELMDKIVSVSDAISNDKSITENPEYDRIFTEDTERDDITDHYYFNDETYQLAKDNKGLIEKVMNGFFKDKEHSLIDEYITEKAEQNKKIIDTAQGDLFGSVEKKTTDALDEIKKRREEIKKENESKGIDSKRINTKRGESEYKLIGKSDKEAPMSPERESKFKEFLSKNLPGVKFEVLPHSLKTENGAYAWGAYDHNYRKISVRENSPIGTEYHEAGHAVWNSYLSDKEQDELYNEFRNRVNEDGNAIYVDRFGNATDYKKATNKDIREAIMDEFADYQVSGKEWKGQPVKQGFFKRLLNFIKNFIFGKPETIASFFEKTSNAFYADKPIYEKRVVGTEYSETSLDDKVPESWIRQVTDGVIHTSKKFLGISNGQLLKVVDSKLTAGELFDAVFDDLKQFYEHDIYDTEVDNKLLPDETINEVINGKFGWNFIKENWNDIVQKSIDRYDALKIGFKKVNADEFAEANQDTEDNATNENSLYKHHYEETENNNQRDYDRDIFKSNAKKSSPAEIQFLFNTIAKTRNLYGVRNEKLVVPELLFSPLFMEQLVEGNRMFYKTLSSLANKDGLWNLRDAFREVAVTNPELVRVYRALFNKDNANYKDLNEDQWRMLMKFNKAFSKQRPQSPMWIIDESNNSYSMDANSEKDSDNVIKNWWSSFKANKSLSSYAKNGNYIINKNARLVEPKSDKDIIKFFEQIEFPIDEDVLKAIPNTKEGAKTMSEVRENALSLYIQLKKGIAIETRTTSKGVKAETSIKRLAEIVAKLKGNEDESQYARVDGEYVQTNVLHNFMSRTMAAINQAKNLDNFYARFPHVKNDVMSKHSVWLTPGHEGSWYNKEGVLRQEILPQVDGGLRSIKEGVISAEMNKVTRGLHMLNKNLGSRGRALFNNIVPGDSKSEFGMALENVVSISRMVNGTYKPFVENIFKGYLEDEIGLIRDRDRRLAYKVMQGKADKLRFFKNILEGDLLNDLHEFANSRVFDSNTLEDFFTDPNAGYDREKMFKDQMWKWIGSEVNDEFSNYSDNKLIQHRVVNDEDKFFFYGLSTDFVKEFNSSQSKKSGKYIFKESEIKDILKYRLMNLMIHNIELHKVFFGDPAFSKDASKRRKLENSGTESTHIDNGESNGLNNFLNKEWNKSGETYLDKNDWGYHEHSDIVRKFTFKHGDSPSTMIVSDIANELHDLANEPNSEFSKEAAEKYEKVNGIDAQAYTLVGFHREFGMKNGGEPNEDYHKQFNYWEAKERLGLDNMLSANKEQVKKWTGRDFIYSNDSHGKDLKKADQEIVEQGNPEVKGSFYIRKNMASGPIERNDMNVPNKNKMSELSMFWGLFTDEDNNVIRPQMADLYFFMKKNNIKYAGPESQQKEGALNNNPDLYNNETGKIKLDDSNLDKVYGQNLMYHNKIVENASMHDKQKMGTQQRVLAQMDFMGAGMPKDFWGPKEENYFKEKDNKEVEWSKLSEEEKNNKSEMYKLYNGITNTLNHFFERKFENALSRLGLKDFGEDNYKLVDPDKVVSFLKDASKIYELPDNIKNAIKTTYNPDTQETEVILDYLPNRGALESMVYAIIEKELIRPEMSGGPKVLVSGEMFEKGDREAVYKKNGKWEKVTDYSKLSTDEKKNVRLTSNSYKIYKRGEVVDGKRQKTSLMQVGLPNHFKEELKKWSKRTDKPMKSDKEILEYLNTSEEGKKLLHGVGFRIPTQGLNSIDAFEVVEFLPQELGDVIVVPAEITTKVGSDFDIDKLNTYMHNFVIGDNGFPERVNFIEDTNSVGNLKDLYKANYGNSSKNADAFVEAIFSGKTPDYVPSLEEYIKENKGKNPYKLNTEEALQNKYFEQLEDAVTLPDNYERLMTPNSSDEMKEIEEYVTSVRNKGVTEKASDINYANQLNPQWIVNERQTFLDSKSQVGTPAMNNVSHAISQSNAIYINPDKSKINSKDVRYLGKDAINKFDFNIRLPHNEVNVNGQKYTSLSGLVNNKKMYISDILSQVINGAVDAASDPWLSRLLQSKALLSVSLFLERVGVDIEHSQLFLNQPVIDEYLKQSDAQRYTAGINPDMNWLFRDKIIQNVKNLKGVFTGSKMTFAPDEFSISDLKEMFETYHLKGANSLTAEQRGLQKHILDEFIKYQMFSGDLFQMQQGTYWGNLRKPNDITIDLKNIMLEHHDKNGIIKGGKENMDNGFMGTIRDKAIKLSRAASTIFKVSSPNARRVIEPIKKVFGNPLLKVSMENRVTAITKAKDSLLDYLVQNTNYYNNQPINNYIKEFLLDKDSAVSNLLQEVQKVLSSPELKDSNLSDNLAIKKLAASLKDNVKDIKNIQLDNKPSDVFTSNSLTRALAELRDSGFAPARELYHKLLVTGMLQSGIRDSRTSYNKFTPYNDYIDILKPAIHAIDQNSDLLQSFLNTDSYYRNNWMDDNIVPKVKMRVNYQTGEEYYPYYSDANLMKTFGIGYKFLSLHEWSNNSKYPVVKITEPRYSFEDMTKLKNAGYTYDQLYKTSLYKKVEQHILMPDGTIESFPIATTLNKEGVAETLYKPINAWGKGNELQEHYTDVRPSVLDTNDHINEFADEDIISSFKGTETSNEEYDDVMQNTPEEFQNKWTEQKMDDYSKHLDEEEQKKKDNEKPLDKNDEPDTAC